MKVAVVGSRTIRDQLFVEEKLNLLFPVSEIISGGAKGADTLAAEWARRRGIKVTAILPEWERYGNSAGFKRNVLIIEAADKLIAFWDGSSRGTKHSIELAKKKGIEVIIYMMKDSL